MNYEFNIQEFNQNKITKKTLMQIESPMLKGIANYQGYEKFKDVFKARKVEYLDYRKYLAEAGHNLTRNLSNLSSKTSTEIETLILHNNTKLSKKLKLNEELSTNEMNLYRNITSFAKIYLLRNANYLKEQEQNCLNY